MFSHIWDIGFQPPQQNEESRNSEIQKNILHFHTGKSCQKSWDSYISIEKNSTGLFALTLRKREMKIAIGRVSPQKKNRKSVRIKNEFYFRLPYLRVYMSTL